MSTIKYATKNSRPEMNGHAVDQQPAGGTLRSFMRKSVQKGALKVATKMQARMQEKEQEEKRRMYHPGADKKLAESFSYQPVNSIQGQIRLLKILPDTGSNSSREPGLIRCELSNVYLRTAPKYTALSYTWGPPGKLPIWVNGHVFHVGQNLHAALRFLRGHDRPDRYLWIDAICINQRDNDEKSAQVNKMASIYKSAEEVLIWLGYEFAWQLGVIRSIGEAAEAAGVWDADRAGSKENGQPQKPILDLMSNVKTGNLPWQKPPNTSVFYFNPFWTFLELPRSPWFSRVWVLQEVVFARKATLASNNVTIPVSALVSALRLLEIWLDWNPQELVTEQANRKYGSAKHKSEEMMDEVRKEMAYQEPPSVALLKYYRAASTRGALFKKPTLLECLDMIFIKGSPEIQMQATDPLDRIYAVIGLSCDASSEGDLMIVPDYSKSVVGLFFWVAYQLMSKGDLRVLLYCRGRKLDGLPSWAPDWTAEIVAPWSAHDCFFASGRLIPAAPGFGPSPLAAWPGLVIDGIEVGRIASRSTAWGTNLPRDMSDQAARTVKKRIMEVRYLLGQTSLYAKGDTSEAMWQIPIGNKELADGNVTKLATDASFQSYLSLIKFLREYDWSRASPEPAVVPQFFGYSAGLQNNPTLLAQLDPTKGRIPWNMNVPEPSGQHDWKMYYKAMRAMRDSCPVLLSNGYVGLAPGGCQAEDIVIIPYGSRAPLVVRPVHGGSAYELVGEMYGHGIMHGELIEGRSQIQRQYTLV